MNNQHGSHGGAETHPMSGGHYRTLALMAALSFIAMYILMYSMTDRLANVYNNLNQVYMAALMASPMVLIELVLMRRMYMNTRLNAIIATAVVVLGILSFLAIRREWGIGDRQFVRSMIPHHASAILMCEQAPIADTRIRNICEKPDGIVQSQRREIEEMKAILASLR